MSEGILLLGISHHTATTTLLARATPPREEVLRRLGGMKVEGRILGGFFLGTCNRSEILVHAPPGLHSADLEAHFFEPNLSGSLYRHHGAAAMRHLLRVACSLDSMVVGESQILGQVKEALLEAQDLCLLSPELHLLLREALRTAKDVRTRTGISSRPVSIASLTVDLLRGGRDFSPTWRVAVVGAGTMARKAALSLKEALRRPLLLVNRTPARAASLAASVGGQWMGLEAFRADPPPLDAVVAAAGPGEPVVTVEAARRILDGGGALTLMDLAVPPCVERACAEVPGVRLLDLEDLRCRAARNLEERREEARQAENLLERGVRRLQSAFAGRAADLAVIRTLHEDLAEEQAREAVAGELAHLSGPDRERLLALARRLARSHAHLHLTSLKDRIAGAHP